jgi:GTP-binding protein
VVLVTDHNMSTLMDFRYKTKYTAKNGADGGPRNCTGRDGAPLIIKVPDGTIVRDKETNAIIKDMTGVDRFVLARGGAGGWGNKRFATPTRQAPNFAKSGLTGEEREVVLELKLLADVGLIGFPNVGKSTLLSVVSKANPKIADYHFTTLHPNLGVVFIEEGVSFVMADIPGIIEGASEGAGLGHEFLRHIDRCRLLIHVVDAAGSEGRDPVEDFETINKELAEYSPELASRPQLVAANKVDLLYDDEPMQRLRDQIKGLGLEFFEISAATNRGVRELINAVATKLQHLPPIVVYEPEYVPVDEKATPEDITIAFEDGAWVVEGPWMERLVSNVNFSDTESLGFFDKMLRQNGVYDKLEERGVQDGDTVSIYGLEFEYHR